MKSSRWIYIFTLPTMATAASIVYVTDLPGYAPLAKCARNGLSLAINGFDNQCPTGITQLQSCVCTKGNNLNAIRNVVTTSVQVWCSLAATDDVSSAVSVYNGYCNQNGTPPPPQLTSTTNAGGVGGLAVSPSTAASPGSTASVSESETETNKPKQTSSATSISTSTATPSPIPTATSGVPMAAVIGGAVAFVALMVSGLIAFLCYRRTHMRNTQQTQQIQPTTLVPHMPPRQHTNNTFNSEFTHNQSITNNINHTTNNTTPVLEHPQNMYMHPQAMSHPSLQSPNHLQQQPPPFSATSTPTTPYRPGIDYTNKQNRLLEPARNGSSHPSLQNQLPQYRPQQQTPESHSPPTNRRPVARPRNDYEVEEM